MNIISKKQIKKNIKLRKKLELKKYRELCLQPKLITECVNFQVDGCGIVLLKIVNHKIYILLRLVNKIYYIPKGHRKIGETTMDSAIRELNKYTNIVNSQYNFISGDPLLVKYRPFYHHEHCYVNKHMYFYFAMMKDNVKTIHSNEYGSYHWIYITLVSDNYCFEKNLKIIVDYIQRNMKLEY